jgi:GNAT superfamily N-acetyltransferase
MREICMSGSMGASGEQSPEATRPPEASERLRLLQAQFSCLVKYCCAHGAPYTTADEIEGVALWIPPDAPRITSEREHEFGFDQLPMRFGREAFSRYRLVHEYLNTIHQRQMTEPHWYLPIIGVAPSRQASGVGRALLQAILDRAKAEGLPCYLETTQPRNVAFYRKHGFEVLVEGVEPSSGLAYWCSRHA